MKVLIIDDNPQYREAFVRMLSLEGCKVCDAGDLNEALQRLHDERPDVVVTDLQMRTDREGLDVIETIKAVDPVMPVIMISGVGSFEEGALAMRLGATHVIHKNRIEDELEGFVYALQTACETRDTSLAQLAEIARVRERGGLSEGDPETESIKALLVDPDTDAVVKGEAFEVIGAMRNLELLKESEDSMQDASDSARYEERMGVAEASLASGLEDFASLDPEARRALLTAEYLFNAQADGPGVDFSRSVAFSYSLAVECEVRARLKGRITRLSRDKANRRLLDACIDAKQRRIDTAFFDALLQVMRQHEIHVTMANVKYVIMGLVNDKGTFKADGLKDVGILLLCFGRHYTFSKWGQQIHVDNALNIKGFNGDHEAVALASKLIALQYARNPYVHPQPGKREQLTDLRTLSIECLNVLTRLR